MLMSPGDFSFSNGNTHISWLLDREFQSQSSAGMGTDSHPSSNVSSVRSPSSSARPRLPRKQGKLVETLEILTSLGCDEQSSATQKLATLCWINSLKQPRLSLDFLILLLLPPWNYRHVPPHQALTLGKQQGKYKYHLFLVFKHSFEGQFGFLSF